MHSWQAHDVYSVTSERDSSGPEIDSRPPYFCLLHKRTVLICVAFKDSEYGSFAFYGLQPFVFKIKGNSPDMSIPGKSSLIRS